jgi:hypothetical protein
MFDLTSKSVKFKAALVILIAAQVGLTACSTGRVSPDDLAMHEGAVEVTDAEVTPLPTPEPQIADQEISSVSSLESEVPYPQPPRKFKRANKSKRVAKLKKKVKPVEDVIHEVKQEIAKDFDLQKETLMAAAATVESDSSNTTPPQAELIEPAIIDPALENSAALGGDKNWLYVAVAGLLGLSLIVLGVRARSKKSPRRLVLN